MPTSHFALAQQAADAAYNMTLEQTGDPAQASRDYTATMAAYYNALESKRVVAIGNNDGIVYDAAWFQAVIDARLAQTAPEVDLLYMRETTGKWVLP